MSCLFACLVSRLEVQKKDVEKEVEGLRERYTKVRVTVDFIILCRVNWLQFLLVSTIAVTNLTMTQNWKKTKLVNNCLKIKSFVLLIAYQEDQFQISTYR